MRKTMLKRIISVILSVACVLSLASCGVNESGQSTAEKSSSAGIPEGEKIYLDATEEDFNELFSYYDDIMVCSFLRNGFNSETADISYTMPAVKELIYLLYGEQEFIVDSYIRIPRDFRGLIRYEIDYEYQEITAFEENRKVVDPLFRFEDYPSEEDSAQENEWYYSCFYSIDAETVEWILTELFGGTPDREHLISDKDRYIACYYSDGRYYFRDPIGYGGEGYRFDTTDERRGPDGRYIIKFRMGWASTTEWKQNCETTVGLIEKDGKKYWKIFSIVWDKSKMFAED